MINLNETVLGIELGSTRVKAVLIDREHKPIASGSFEWENQLLNGIWTYDMDDAVAGLLACYSDLKRQVQDRYGVPLTTVAAIGISGMMHGYLPFDREGRLLCPFRTWRNRMTAEAAERLSALFDFNIPQRWSIAHLYQAMLRREPHLSRLAKIQTLSGYIHRLLTGEYVVGLDEASGMFPIDEKTGGYRSDLMDRFDSLIRGEGYSFSIRDVLPAPLPAGAAAGFLTQEGSELLDPEGDLIPGIPFAAPEGDAGTGMVATNSVRVRTGNVSGGTSDFAMIVVEQVPKKNEAIDMVTTPSGLPVAMIHCANCTSDINAWVELFSEFAEKTGNPVEKGDLYELLFQEALKGEPDCGGLLSYNYYSGEGITHLSEGRPVFARTPDSRMTLPNFMRNHLTSALATLKIGLEILLRDQKVPIDSLTAHGGFFKTKGVGQRILSAATGVPVSTLETSGEGGPYGMALLAAYLAWKTDGESLEEYLDHKVFCSAKRTTVLAEPEEIDGFNRYVDRYRKAFSVECEAVRTIDL
ncbi:MAG: ATPase [Clostridia bacterium]|nr:ATPase [Clostridia bacterium]